jgi:hypothetical protein
MISTIFEDGLSFDAWVDYKIFDFRCRHTEFKVKWHCETDLSLEIPSKDGPRADTAIADFCPSLAMRVRAFSFLARLIVSRSLVFLNRG